jgi:hypothetical protein
VAACIFGWPIWSDVVDTRAPVFSGGSWVSTLPLANVQDRALHRVARSTSIASSATQFDVDLGAPAPVRILAIPVHTATLGASMRWRGAASSAALTSAPIVDTGFVAMWPAGLSREQAVGLNVAAYVVLPADVTARYWRCEIRDPVNPRGSIDIGRVVIAGGIQPSQGGMSYGARLGLETMTTRSVSDGGATLYDARPVRRQWDFVVQSLPESEVMGALWQMQRIASTHGQLFFVWDPQDPAKGFERNFLCTMRELRPVEIAYATRYDAAFALTEEL